MTSPFFYVQLAAFQCGIAVVYLAGTPVWDVWSLFHAAIGIPAFVFVICPWLKWLMVRKRSDGTICSAMLVTVKGGKRWSEAERGYIESGERPPRRAKILYRPLLTNILPFVVVGADDRWLVEYEDDGSRGIVYHTLLEPVDAITQLGSIV